MLTTHGHTTLAHDEAARVRGSEQLAEIERSLYEHGVWFKNEFGPQGDHGVANADWGTAFLSPEWLLARDDAGLGARGVRPGPGGGEPGSLRSPPPVTSASVVIPVKDGERYLEAVLHGVLAQGDVEVLVIDSGSRDRSREIARAAGVEVLEIQPEDFGHGRTRNLGAERTRGELICFLTQDAEPVDGWLGAYREAFELDERVGAAYGPHLARPDTSPMIARELEQFFAAFSPTGEPVIQGSGDPPFLSNVNACYRRACWEEIRFEDVAYAEDQAFGRALLEAGWLKAYHPRAAVVHAHDYGAIELHAPLLRRVPRPARDDRPRGAAAGARGSARRAGLVGVILLDARARGAALPARRDGCHARRFTTRAQGRLRARARAPTLARRGWSERSRSRSRGGAAGLTRAAGAPCRAASQIPPQRRLHAVRRDPPLSRDGPAALADRSRAWPTRAGSTSP